MILLLFTIVVLYVIYSWITVKPRNFPPGPPTIPILGCIPFLSQKNPHFDMEKWRELYGGVVGLVLGSHLAVVVCEPKLVREVLKRDEFQARPIDNDLSRRSFNRRIGIMFADDQEWQEQRRFTLRHLKEFGFGKTSMESVIVDEIVELMEEVRNQRVEASKLFNLSSVNVLWSVMAGIRYKRSDPRLQNLMQHLTELFRSGNTINRGDVTAVFPFLRYIFPTWRSARDIATRDMHQLFMEVIKEHEYTLDINNPRDFIDVYLTEMRKQGSAHSSFDQETLITICSDLFGAGAESVGNSVAFALLYMVLHPDIQAKVHAEIDAIVGRARKPSLQDRNDLRYVEAVLMEVLRCNTIAPVTVPHRNFVDTSLNGYFIPKSTTVIISLWSIMQDKEHWGDPQNFRPSRFLAENGKLIKDEVFIPFGVGKRLCPGEALARNIIFLFFTSLMQEFSIHLPPGHSKPSTVCLSGFTTAPQPFEVIFKSRD